MPATISDTGNLAKKAIAGLTAASSATISGALVPGASSAAMPIAKTIPSQENSSSDQVWRCCPATDPTTAIQIGCSG